MDRNAMINFKSFVYTPAGYDDATLAIAACRAGGIGILNAELSSRPDVIRSKLDYLSRKANGEYGMKVDDAEAPLLAAAADYAHRGLHWLILDAEIIPTCLEWIAKLRQNGVCVLAEMKTAYWPESPLDEVVDGLVLKGNESGGFVGESSCFILLQKWRKQTSLPFLVRGGVTPHVAAACSAVGAIGGVLDCQVLLLEESPLMPDLLPVLEKLSGNETITVGNEEENEYFRLLVRPGYRSAQEFFINGEGKRGRELKQLVQGKIDWKDPINGLLPLGQDVCFAGPWRQKYGHMAAVLRAIDISVDNSLRQAVDLKPLAENAPLAQSIGTTLPIVQGPMTRVSDNVQFAAAVSQGGALPTLALSLMKGPSLNQLLEETAKALDGAPWGIGLLGFAPQSLFDEQLAAVKKYRPDFAVIAGGRPDQALKLEESSINSYLHVPSANLIPLFLQEGARRFIFEGRECGGHVGPLSSFVLWSTMVDRLLSELEAGEFAVEDIYVLFAGGIHDAVSSAMVQVLAAPLAVKGVKIGILMGSSYIFTKEIVNSGAIVPTFQTKAIDCEHTVCLQSGPGHASRCAYTPFAKTFLHQRIELREKKVPAGEMREALDKFILGRLRLATRGCARTGSDNELHEFDESYQQQEGMYMLGQVATLRKEVTDISALHREVTEIAHQLLVKRLDEIPRVNEVFDEKPVDIAIVGIAAVLPKANTPQDYWENILNKVNAITEIPPHRWDWHLYYDENRQAKDKVYSKWGGFIDDMAFDPTRYGIPPKSIESVDPMQLMALEVARRILVDAGYEKREFDRLRTSIIIGASGGVGDVGMQYGLRSEFPRFQGNLPESVAGRLPEWTEDTFAGILPNVVAGRIANRLNFGGVNFTTDAACASSLAAIYQGVSELAAGRSDFVISGGVDTVQGPFGYMCFSKTQALSPRGRCETFDTSADGIVISEGIAMIAMKRLKDAERDADRIYAVIKGVGGSSDGRARGLTAPEPAGQLLAMRRAYNVAGFGPDTVELYEAHGTGTVAGDTAELESTTQLLKKTGCTSRQAAVGSVKTLIGHTKATAGVAGIIKTVLALHHRVLPPHCPVNQPNQVLQHDDSPLYLLDEALPWLKTEGRPRRAAASAFGFGGTNFHIVMEEYTGEYRPWMSSAVTQRWPAELLLWGGRDRDDLVSKLAHLQHGLEKTADIELRDLAYNLAKNWQPGQESIALVALDSNDLRNKIGAALEFLKGDSAVLTPGIYHGTGATSDGKLAVLFSGQGSQYTNMIRELALHFPALSETLAQADELLSERFAERFGENMLLSRFIFPRGVYGEQDRAAATKALTGTDVAQPALGAVGAGLWKLMRNLGLKPDMLGGHSYGEFVALFAGGYIDFGALMSLSEARGRFIVDAVNNAGAELGTMAAVQASREDVEKKISHIDDVIVANHNGPQQSIISGATAAVQEAVTRFTKAGINAREIPVAAAFHSPFVMPAQTAMAELIETMTWKENESGIPVYSNTTGERHAKDIRRVKQVMIDHLVKPVEFLTQIEAMYRAGARVFLELGPKTVLTGLVSRILGEARPHKAIAIDGYGSGIAGMLKAIGQLLCAGVKLDVIKLFEGRQCIDGDPADLNRMQHEVSVPKHVWMLNGAGARRYTEPVKQIGVRMDAPSTRSIEAPRQKTYQHATTQAVSKAADGMMTIKHRKEEPHMRRRGKIPNNGEPSVMAEYFDTMRLFLETQERVMASYMGDVSTHGRRGSWPQRTIQARALYEQAEPARGRIHRQDVLPPQAEPTAAPMANTPQQLQEKAEPHVQKQTLPITAQVEKAAAEPSQAEASSQGYDHAKVTAILLSIVEEKTGYPKDMVGLDQNLEAELGIDSIKRVEIVGALLKSLPPSFNKSLDGDRGKLNTQTTLNGMVELLVETNHDGSAAIPFKQTGVGSKTHQSRHSLRHIIETKQEPIDESVISRLEHGHFILTLDRLGVAQELAELLRTQDCTLHMVAHDVLKDEKSLSQWCTDLRGQSETISGIIHLAQIGSDQIQEDASTDSWYHQLQLNEKSLFLLLHNLSDMLKAESHILSASSLGGFFSRKSGEESGLFLQGGSVGLIKSLYQERPGLRVKAVDVDPNRKPEAIASDLLAELEVVGGRQEVGYPDGKRTIFTTVAAPVVPKESLSEKMDKMVLLATGGAKGVTAEVVREFAIPGNTLLLTGRSPLSGSEPEHLRSLTDAEELRQHFVSEVRKGRLEMTPARIRDEIRSILSARELQLNIEDFRQRGATVEYFAVNVTDEDAMRQLLDNIYEQYGTIDGVVHGAGVIEDKLLADKTSDSWSRVVETKVIGMLLLQKYLHSESLKFFTVFSSVAGRYGNSGQSDYATANEMMNRLCCQLSRKWGSKVTVKALCWGPWGTTKFGKGMVTEFTEAKFAEKGVALVGAEEGPRLFRDELFQDDGQVEIICGIGPWEQQETIIGRMEKRTPSVETGITGPLLHNAAFTASSAGNQMVTIELGDTHDYLKEHCIDNIPVLPAAAALEIMSEAASQFWPGWTVVEVSDCRLLKGIELKSPGQKFNLTINPPTYGSSEGFEVNVAIQSDQSDGRHRLHYRAVLHLAQQCPQPLKLQPQSFIGKELSVTKAYNDLLFHGPRFQVIEKINGLSEDGANALVRTTRPVQWLDNMKTNHDKWVFDPAVIDAAAQMAILWCRTFRDETSLPVRFGRVVRCAETLPDKLYMQFERLPGEDSHAVRANVYYADADNQVALLIEDMECVSSAGLNRIGGTATTSYPNNPAAIVPPSREAD